MSTMHSILLNIRRHDPETQRSWVQAYSLEVSGMLRFTDLLRKINQEQDPGLAWTSSCEHAQCGSCSAVVNGKPLLLCELLVQDAVALFASTSFDLEPLNVAPVLRDLIVDLAQAYERVHQAKPYLIDPADPPPEGDELRIPPKVMEPYVEATRCINCFCCAQACVSSHRNFLGPNAMLVNIVRLFDPKEQARAERLALLSAANGLPRCHTARACSFVCPKEIDVAHFLARGKAGRFS
ncbi:MAG: 4Fe-4S dicluster domain-containing protein [Desulfohalobiaceae bacterium]|nr:4Fe-4S dicluster domain-containing protein [Desulfohalobiaceae bacterium]